MVNTFEPAFVVQTPGPLSTVQDAGRFGMVALGVGTSGACDLASYALANRIVGNQPGAACLEVTFGGLVLRVLRDVTCALTGARGPAVLTTGAGGRRRRIELGHGCVVQLPAGAELSIGTPTSGVRTYLAVRGGFGVEPVLGSRSTDVLSGLGPPALAEGTELPVGAAAAGFPVVDWTPVVEPPAGEVTVRVLPGPRRDWCTDAAWSTFLESAYAVSTNSNRVGIRLDGPALKRRIDDELPSEGMLRGAVQLPPAGTPVVFLADHPLTGGYPVIGCVHDEDVDRCGQLRPGQTVRFREVAG